MTRSPEELPDHFCPGCGAPQRSFPRYPWYFCVACLETACDDTGRALRFANEGFMGGLAWRYEDETEVYGDQPVLCQIKGRKVMVQEARFGGVVAEPLASGMRPDRAVDLLRGGLRDEVRAGLRKISR